MKGKSPEVTKTEVQPKYPGFATAMNELSAMAPGISKTLGNPYSGQQVAPLDPLQQGAYQKFSNYLAGGGAERYLSDPMYQQSKGLMSDVLGGKYLTADNPLTDFTRKKLWSQDVPEAQSRLRQAQSIRGNLYSDNALRSEGDILNSADETMAGIYANQYGGELNRQMGMIPAGMTLAQQESQAPLQTVDQMNQMGEFLRQLQQQQDDADYQEFLRQRQEQLMPLNMAPQGSQIYPQYEYGMTEGEPSIFSKYISPALQIGALGLAPFTGGATLAAMPFLGAADKAFQTPGTDAGGFANFTNAFAPYAGMAMGGISGLQSFMNSGLANNAGQAYASQSAYGGSAAPDWFGASQFTNRGW